MLTKEIKGTGNEEIGFLSEEMLDMSIAVLDIPENYLRNCCDLY